MRPWPHGRKGRGLLPVLMVAWSVLTGGLVSAQAPDIPGFADGIWDGTLSFSGFIDQPTTLAGAVVTGTFSIEVTAGQIVAGGFSTEGLGLGAAEFGGTGTLDALMLGEVEGTARVVGLIPKSVRLQGVITVGGVDNPLDVELGPADLAMIPLAIESASCSVVTGTWTWRIRNVADSAGGSATVNQDRWVATWKKEASAEVDAKLQAALTQLLEDAAAYEASLGGKVIPNVAEGFESLLRRADELALSIPLNTGCGIGPPGGFLSVLANLVERLLLTLVNELGVIASTTDYLRAIVAGFHTGVLGSASTSVHKTEIVDGLVFLLSNWLDAHAQYGLLGDADQYLSLHEISQIKLAAELLGDDDLAAYAQALYEATQDELGEGVPTG